MSMKKLAAGILAILMMMTIIPSFAEEAAEAVAAEIQQGAEALAEEKTAEAAPAADKKQPHLQTIRSEGGCSKADMTNKNSHCNTVAVL